MRRRELMLLLGAAMTAARGLRAQQKAMPSIGFLGGGSPGPFAPFVAAFHEGLSETGYVEGQNVAVPYRWAEGGYDRLPAMAADLVARKVDVIAAAGGTPSALAAKNATSTIPIVFLVADPLASGLVTSLARPGGNLTGVDMFTLELMAKRLELLSELVPQARVIAVLVNPSTPIAEGYIRNAQEAASAKGGAAPSPEGQRRKRDRRRLRNPRPTAYRRGHRRRRSVFRRPTGAASHAGGTRCRSGDLCVA